MPQAHLPSLDLLIAEAHTQREAQLVHFGALDAKAGVVSDSPERSWL